MINTTLRYSCDLDHGVIMQPLKTGFITGDMKAHRFEISCYRGPRRKEVNLSSSAIDAYFVRADGSTVYITGKVANNMAVIVLPAACYTHAGRFSLVIRAIMDDVKHTIYWAEGTMTSGSTETLVDPGQTIPDLADLLAQIAAMEAATQDADDAATSALQAAKAANEAAADVDAAVQAGLQQYADTLATKAPVIVETLEGEICVTDVAADMPLQGLRLFGKTTQAGTPAPDSPVPLVNAAAGGAIQVHARGKNLLEPQIPGNNYLTLEDDGAYLLEAQGTTEIGSITFVKGIAFSLSITRKAGSGPLPCLILRRADGSNYKTNYGATDKPLTVTPDEDISVSVVIQANSGNGYAEIGQSFYVQVEIGSAATVYEPCKDGGSVTVSAPNGLPGIPVTSGGNYTDATGQQWISDEIDLGRGVYIKRVNRLNDWTTRSISTHQYANDNYYVAMIGSDGLAAAKSAGVCTHLPQFNDGGASLKQAAVMFILVGSSAPLHVSVPTAIATTPEELRQWLIDNNVEICYAMKDSVETPLSADDLAAYKAMRSTKPNTTVYNDAGAWQHVDCAADTKLYIDKKFNELQSAILSQGANV